VHQAKGLEWNVVIILWLAEGMFPSARALAESENGDAEERRLFYVAVTRARDELFLCFPEIRRRQDGAVMYLEPSRFVREIPSEYLREIYPRRW
jgi:DNA helicase-2/ATP-dependent DNA helicase PcrA